MLPRAQHVLESEHQFETFLNLRSCFPLYPIAWSVWDRGGGEEFEQRSRSPVRLLTLAETKAMLETLLAKGSPLKVAGRAGQPCSLR